MAASIKFPKREVVFKFREKDMTIHPSQKGSSIPIVETAHVSKLIKSFVNVYMVFVKECPKVNNKVKSITSETNKELDNSNFLKEFQYIFTNDLGKIRNEIKFLISLPPTNGWPK